MLFWKIFVHVATGVVTAAAIVMQVYNNDKRTKAYRRTKNTFIAASIILFSSQLILLIVDHQQTNRQAKQLSDNVDSLKHASNKLQRTADSTQNELHTITLELGTIRQLMLPLAANSIKHFKEPDTTKALVKLNKEIIKIFHIQSNRIVATDNKGIITMNQSGGTNTINNVNPIVGLPPYQVELKHLVTNVIVTSIPNIHLDSRTALENITLPHDNIPFKQLYHNQVRITYFSEIGRSRFLVAVQVDGVIGGNIGLETNDLCYVSHGRVNDTNYLVMGVNNPFQTSYLANVYSDRPIENITEKLQFFQ